MNQTKTRSANWRIAGNLLGRSQLITQPFSYFRTSGRALAHGGV